MDMFKLLTRGSALRPEKPKQETKKDTLGHLDFFAPPSPKSIPDAVAAAQISSTKQAQQYRSTRNVHVHVSGTDQPLPVAEFSSLLTCHSLSQRLVQNLIHLGYTECTPIQSEAVPALLCFRDLLACAPTGTGKTLAYLLPLIHQAETVAASAGALQSVIVAPTHELCSQIYESLFRLSRGLKVKVANLDRVLVAKMKHGANKSLHILVSTPQRLAHAASHGLVDLASVRCLILDEADRLLGAEFVEQTDEVINLCTNSALTKAIFSATMPKAVEDLANSIMHSPLRVIVGSKEAAAASIAQELRYCGNEHGKLTALRQTLSAGGFNPPILVFVQSIIRAKSLYHELLYDKVSVDVIHSELSANQRQRAVESFKSGTVWVLICTDLLARGIDFHGVNLVVNYDVPLTSQAYVHRIGRTGRANQKGAAITYFTDKDLVGVRPIVNVMKNSGCVLPEWLLEAVRPTKKHHAKLRAPIARDDISTVPKAIKRQRQKRLEMVAGSKRRTQRAREGKKKRRPVCWFK